MDNILQQRWMRGGDKCSQNFFSTFKKKTKETELLELLDSDGNVLNEWEDMAEMVIHYFTQAFSSNPNTDP